MSPTHCDIQIDTTGDDHTWTSQLPERTWSRDLLRCEGGKELKLPLGIYHLSNDTPRDTSRRFEKLARNGWEDYNQISQSLLITRYSLMKKKKEREKRREEKGREEKMKNIKRLFWVDGR